MADLNSIYRAFACRCTDGRLWLEPPRHLTCADCGALIRSIELVDRDAAAFYRHERDRLREQGHV